MTTKATINARRRELMQNKYAGHATNPEVSYKKIKDWPTNKDIENLRPGEHLFYPLPSNYRPDEDVSTRRRLIQNVVYYRIQAARTKRVSKTRNGKRTRSNAYYPHMINRSFRLIWMEPGYEGSEEGGYVVFREADREPDEVKVNTIAKVKSFGEIDYVPYASAAE